MKFRSWSGPESTNGSAWPSRTFKLRGARRRCGFFRLLLEPGYTCWRHETAGRFALLPENATYFEALAAALPLARKSILILGWQFDPRTRLHPEGRDHHQVEIGHLLRRLVRERPELKVRLLIWRQPLPIAWTQDFYPQRAFRWFSNERLAIDFRLDRARPFGACHHQKVVVIDDRLAFCGGGDISVDRWDTAEHIDHNPLRCTPTGLIRQPRHEVMTLMDGEAARAFADLARQRWLEGTGETLEPVELDVEAPVWPEGVPIDARDVKVGIARTEPAWRGQAGVRESEFLHLECIAKAKRLIYLENQYFTSPLVAAALALRLEEKDGPEVVVISTARAPSWFDHLAMDGARQALLQRLRRADLYGRLSAWTPVTAGGNTIIVHSKVTCIDDRLLRVGSTNLNNRSAGFDTECDVAIEADWEGDDVSLLVQRTRCNLIGHFLGVDGETFREAHAEMGKVGAAIRKLNTQGRLRQIGTKPASAFAKAFSEWQLGDPASPGDSWRPWRRRRLSRAFKQTVAYAAEAEREDAAG
ncbi:MAG: phospholipase [Proteobacteria bacterium]|nr:phospholipase [Pseudomonadota bacterium]